MNAGPDKTLIASEGHPRTDTAGEVAAWLPELLAPAGDWDCARAAVENGADAIYFGLEKFNARMRAQNFTEADLPRLMEFLHRRGVKGYVTFNTLVFENELAEAEQYSRAIIAAGVDAAIVQDAGICRLLRRLSSDFPIHASTQMTVTSQAGVDFARDLGCNLVVLARECSVKEIAQMAQPGRGAEQDSSTRPAPMPLEVFIHGALCVAYSGQCLTSEALGGRSANRGECAQACRMPYDLVSDGKLVPLSDRKYLLSPQDLAGLEVLPELVQAGVASLKIEGRLKTPEYVASITRIYRQALDRLGPRRTSNPEPAAPEMALARVGDETFYEMQMAFSRGLYTGWFRGTNNQALVHGRFGKKRGVYLGQVSEVRRDGVVLRLESTLKPGDGIVFDGGRPEEKEEGGRVYEILNWGPSGSGKGNRPRENGEVLLRFGRGDIDFARVHAGDKLWKTSDPELVRRLRQSYEGDRPRFQRPIFMEVFGRVGQPLTVIARDGIGHVVRVDSAVMLEQAERQPLTTQKLTEQLGRLGGTCFRLGGLTNTLQGEVLVPLSELNRLRREVVSQLEVARARPLRWHLESGPEPACGPRREPAHGPHAGAGPRLIVLVRNLSQLEAGLGCGIRTLYCDFEDPKKFRDAVRMVRNAPSPAQGRLEVFAAPPRIFKMGEEWTLKQVRSSEADGYLVRNYDHLTFFANDRCVGDYSLNVANRWAAEYFRDRFGLERLTASYDLNFTQLEALLQGAPPAWFEITIHQHMPMFHMEHCIFCAFLSTGTDYRNCGRPCDVHDVRLRDRVGAEHPVKADAGCRNTVFNSLAQTGAEYVSRMIALGAGDFRIEFLNESPAQVADTIGRYARLLRGETNGSELWRELRLLNQLGVTRGQMAGSHTRG